MKLVLTSIECHLVGILYVVEKNVNIFQRNAYNHSMLLARLAGRPRPQWGRLIVKYAASLHEERSESRIAMVASGILIPPPNLREVLSMRMNWFRNHLWGERQYWKNKNGEPLQVTISSILSTGYSLDKYYNHYNCSFFPLHSASGLGFGYFLFLNIFLGTYI